MDTLFSRHRNAVVLVAVLFLQLVLLAFQVKRDKDVPLIRIWAVALITPLEKLASGVIHGVADVWYNYADLRDARQQSRELGEEVARLKLSHHRLQEEALEARRLKELLEFRGEVASATVAARVIGSSASETSRVLFLDKGSNAGIRPNMPVITPDGIVGKVHRVFWGSSQVLVITDPDSGVGALLEKSRVHGALRGYSGFFCQLRYIVTDEKVDVGERVFTSGEDLIYPKGLPVGVVTSAKPGPVFKEITVQPFARLNRLEEVLVIVRNVEQEILSKPETAPEPAVTEAPGRQTAPPASPPLAAGSSPAARPASPAGGAASSVVSPVKPSARPPLPGVGDGARARPETDADKLQEAYRAAAARKAPSGSPAARKPPVTAVPEGPPRTTTVPPATPGTGPATQGTRPATQGARPAAQGARPAAQGARPAAQGGAPPAAASERRPEVLPQP